MNEEVYSVLLNGMPFKTFLGFFLLGLIGAVLFYLGKIYKALNPNMPKLSLSVRQVLQGLIKMILSLASLAISIIYFKDMSPHLFDIIGASEDAVIQIKGFSAILLGLGIDRLWDTLLKAGSSGAKLMKRQ